MMKYTILDVNAPQTITTPNDVIVVGIDYTWKFCKITNMVYFTRFDAFMEFLNENTDQYGVPMCGNALVNDANKNGRFSILRNLIRAKKLRYHDHIGNLQSCVQNTMAGHTYIATDNQLIQNDTASGTDVGQHTPAARNVQSTASNTAIDKPLVSVILPHYNRSGLVQNSISSLINQTYEKLEILVVDDCSTDEHFNNLMSYLSQLNDSRVKLYRCNKNVGPYVCKNEMIRVAAGKYITMQDSDDTSDPKRIEHQVKHMESDNVMICYVEASRSKTKTAYVQCLSAAMYDKRVFVDVGFFDTVRYGADSEFNERARTYYGGGRVASISKKLYFVGFDGDCLTSAVPPDSEPRRKYYEECCKYIHKTNIEKLYLSYPALGTRKFYAPHQMIADITGLVCERSIINEQKIELKQTSTAGTPLKILLLGRKNRAFATGIHMSMTMINELLRAAGCTVFFMDTLDTVSYLSTKYDVDIVWFYDDMAKYETRMFTQLSNLYGNGVPILVNSMYNNTSKRCREIISELNILNKKNNNFYYVVFSRAAIDDVRLQKVSGNLVFVPKTIKTNNEPVLSFAARNGICLGEYNKFMNSQLTSKMDIYKFVKQLRERFPEISLNAFQHHMYKPDHPLNPCNSNTVNNAQEIQYIENNVNRVMFQKNIHDWLGRFRLYVSIVTTETFSMVPAEAQSCGTFVLYRSMPQSLNSYFGYSAYMWNDIEDLLNVIERVYYNADVWNETSILSIRNNDATNVSNIKYMLMFELQKIIIMHRKRL